YNPTTKLRGKFSRSQFDFEVEFNKVVGRNPTAQETEAYWTYVQLNDFDWVTRNMRQYTMQTRMGFEEFYFGKGPQGIEARLLPELPWNAATNARILVLKPDGTFEYKFLKNTKHQEQLKAMPGARVFQPSRFSRDNLKAWIGENSPISPRL